MKESESANISKDIVTYEVDDTTCSVCYAEFLDPEDLEVHIQQVHPSLPSGTLVKCQFCDKCFTDAETYVLHIRDDHLLNFKSCSICYRIFTSYSDLKTHETIHPRSMSEGTFACSQCDQFFLYKSELQLHELDKHYDSDDGAFLNAHYALLSSVINMQAETLIHSFANDKDHSKEFAYVCACCKHRDMDLEAYIMHLKKKNCRSLVCNRCFKVYNKRASLVYHLSQQPNCATIKELSGLKKKKVKPGQCSKCKGYFDTKSMKKHSCSTIIKCSHCDIVFKTLYELSEHQNRVHPLAVALVMCKFCQKECVGPESLEKHIQRTHSHEFHLYKYTCTYCDIAFKHPQRLFAHYFRKHKDIEPYTCKICDKKFRIRKGFTLHIKLQHKSEGYVEFDEKLHVFFTDKKSKKPFQPVSMYVQENSSAADNTASKDKEGTSSNSQDLQLDNIDSDESPNETKRNKNDGTERVGRKRVRDVVKIDEVMPLSDYDSDDEPLLLTKKKAKLKRQLRKKPLQFKKKTLKNTKKQFTCGICKKYCYTFQNYQNHVSMHFRDESKKCIKCSLSFKTKIDLQRHMTDQHSSSQLTETLKNILERRKKGEQKQEMSITDKFLKTIKKVHIEKDDSVTATLSPITKELSLQKFIENFTPEGGEVKSINITNSISITKVTNPVEKEPVIKMTKFTPAPPINESHIKLAMPVRFKKSNESHSVTVRKVLTRTVPNKIKVTYDDGNQFQDDDNDYNYNDDTKDSIIPEVEQEVTLEGTEEVPKRNPATHKIVIPKLPKGLKSKIRIAHLLPEAPYYKIVKMDDILKTQQEKDNNDVEDVAEDVRLPDGTKLVHVNPLAHLLGDTPVEQIMKPSKYYKPKPKNFEAVLAKALRKLDNPNKQVKKKKRNKNNELIVPDKDKSETDKELDSNDIVENTAVNDESETVKELESIGTVENAAVIDENEKVKELESNHTVENVAGNDENEVTEDVSREEGLGVI